MMKSEKKTITRKNLKQKIANKRMKVKIKTKKKLEGKHNSLIRESNWKQKQINRSTKKNQKYEDQLRENKT